jgi:hypothetical protein
MAASRRSPSPGGDVQRLAAAGWRGLRILADREEGLDSGRLDELISSARRQADLLEELRVRAAA